MMLFTLFDIYVIILWLVFVIGWAYQVDHALFLAIVWPLALFATVGFVICGYIYDFLHKVLKF